VRLLEVVCFIVLRLVSSVTLFTIVKSNVVRLKVVVEVSVGRTVEGIDENIGEVEGNIGGGGNTEVVEGGAIEGSTDETDTFVVSIVLVISDEISDEVPDDVSTGAVVASVVLVVIVSVE